MNESLTQAICAQLDSIPAFEASRALAVLAVQSEWRTVRDSAIKCLNDRRIDDFAPILLAEMRSPFSTAKANSAAESPTLFFREEADRYFAVELQFVPSGSVTTFFPPWNQLSRLEMETDKRRENIDRARFAADV